MRMLQSMRIFGSQWLIYEAVIECALAMLVSLYTLGDASMVFGNFSRRSAKVALPAAKRDVSVPIEAATRHQAGPGRRLAPSLQRVPRVALAIRVVAARARTCTSRHAATL